MLKKILARARLLLFRTLSEALVLFDPHHYLRGNNLPGWSSGRATLHYLFVARANQRESAYPLFDYGYFRQQLAAKGLAVEGELLRAYLGTPGLWELSPHPLFDPAYYCAQLPARPARAPLLDYYLRADAAVDPHPLFSQAWYLGRNPHLRHSLSFAGATALSHFHTEGYRRGELPNPYFHTIWYANHHLDRDRISLNPLLHWLERGHRRGLSPSPLFDAPRYRADQDLPADIDPLAHFLCCKPLQLPVERNRLTDMFWPAIGQGRPPAALPEPGPEKFLVILFTPRSGSTWLTGLLTKTGVLGHPTEWFNFRMIGRHCAAMGYYANNLPDYIAAVTRLRAGDNRLFSTELSAEDIANLEPAGELDQIFPGASYCLLYRRDLLAQAVSLFLATHSGFFSSDSASNAVHQPDYNARGIRLRLEQVLAQENRLVDYLERHSLDAHLLCYEDLVEAPLETVGEVLEQMNESITAEALTSLTGGQKKRISNQLNTQYIDRFRREQPRHLARCHRRRKLKALQGFPRGQVSRGQTP